jgi:lysophosphatidate acyltransferase
MLVFYCISSSTLNYYLKLMIIYIGFLNMSIWQTLYGIFHTTYETSRFAKKLLDPLGYLLGIKFTVKGAELINKDQPYIIVCNHQHALDIISVMQIWDKFDKAAVAAKKELKWMATFGIGLQMAGAVFIERNHKAGAKDALNKAVQKAKSNKTSIALFPEGTRHLRSSDGINMLQFKKGAFHMALNAGLPILPIVISEYTFIDEKRKRFENCNKDKKLYSRIKPRKDLQVTISILQPIETEALSLDDIDKLVEKTRNEMMSTFEDTSKKQ